MNKYLLALLALIGIGCKPSPAPAPAPTSKPVIALIGGKGQSQMGPVSDALTKAFPSAVIENFGPVDGWASDVTGWLSINSKGPIVIVGHSYGANTACDTARALMWSGRKVSLLILLDAVNPNGSDITIPAGVPCVAFHARFPTLFIWRANLHGAYQEITTDGFHNDCPANAAGQVVAYVKGVL